MDLRDSSCSWFAILPAPAECLLSTLLLFVRSNFFLPHLILVGFLRPVVIVFTHLLSVRKTSCSRFRCILGELFVDLVLDRLLTNRLVFLLPAVGDALLSPAVGYALVLPAVGYALVLPANGYALFASFSSFLLCSLGFGPLSIVTRRPSSFFDFALSSAI